MNGQSGLTGRLRTIDLDDASLRIAAYAECIVEGDTAGRNHFDVLDVFITELHDGAFAEVFLNLRHGCLKCLQLTLVRIQISFLHIIF